MKGKTNATSFAGKAVAAGLLAALADWLFYGQWIGGTLGGFALAWALLLAVMTPAVWRKPGPAFSLLIAIIFALILIDDPRILTWILFWTALSSAALLSRARFGDAFQWLQRMAVHAAIGWIQLILDLGRGLRFRRPLRRGSLVSLGSLLALPVIGGLVFLTLFATANPLIADMLLRLQPPPLVPAIPHAVVWAAAMVAIWPSFRTMPRITSLHFETATFGGVMPQFRPASVALSLITFNAVFALQNALDIAFLWSGARLPGTITMADYAHRGAFSLMATALLAALFVLTVLRPGSASAGVRSIRWLVSLWVAQNLLLVASSMLRTMDYIGSYSLTVMRIAALAWMALVGVGLVLICWRLLRGKSTGWLINANAAAAGAALLLASIVDPAAIAASWNVRNAQEVGGGGPSVDLCYLREQGSSALLPLIELENAAQDPGFKERVRALRADAMATLIAGQSDWHGWTWRGARRLAAAQSALGDNPPQPGPAPHGRNCDGSALAPPEAVDSATPPPPAALPDPSAPAPGNEDLRS